MSAHVRETVAVFTRNRILILAGVVVVLIGGTALLLVTRPTAKQPVTSGVLGVSTSSGATSSPSPVASSTPAPTVSPAPTPTPTVATNAASSPATTSSTTAGTSGSVGHSSGPPACTTVARLATLQVGFTTYRQDETVQATTTIKNLGPTCVLTNNTVTASFLASNGATVNTRTVAVTSSSTWASNQTLSAGLSWNLENCSTTPCSAQPPGTYTLSVTWPGVKALTESFNVISSLTCVESDIAVGIQPMPTSFSSGQAVVVTGTLTNISNHACSANQTTDLIIKDQNGNIVFGAGLGSSSNTQTWNPGQVLTYQFTWNENVCLSKSCVPAPAYFITFTDSGGLTAGPLKITISK
jgi:hypothetical protein